MESKGAELNVNWATPQSGLSFSGAGSNLDPRKIQGAYGLLNARIGLGAPDDKWAVELWSANLADKLYYQVAFDAPFQFNQIDAFLGAPRTFGLTVRTKF